MPRLEGLGYRLEDNMHLLNLDAQGQPMAPPKPGAPVGPAVVPPLPGQKASSSVNDADKRKAGKPSKKPLNTAQCTSIIDALKEVYKQKVKPLEESFKFGSFFSPTMTDADFDGKPQVLLLGQYSTGKTTFIKHLIGREYPGCHIGPEPTTDRFVVVCHGIEDRITPGNTLAVQPDQPYSGLSHFGTGFLSKFQSSCCKARLLEEITIVDTPGVLSGEKQRIERSYDFVDVTHWFATRCDLIILLFDPHKLDISDEFKAVMSSLRGHDDKVRVVLNKADTVDAQQLMRVYGALMWSLGKVFNTPEVVKVYVGSFNTLPIDTVKNPLGALLFEKEQADLMHDLIEIPSRACDRKVNEFVKRVRACRTHMILAGSLRKQMPAMFGHEEKQRKLLGRLEKEFEKCQLEYQLPRGDLPNADRYRQMLTNFDLNKFPKLDKKHVDILDAVLSQDLPAISACRRRLLPCLVHALTRLPAPFSSNSETV